MSHILILLPLLLFKILWVMRREIIQLVAKDIIYTCGYNVFGRAALSFLLNLT